MRQQCPNDTRVLVRQGHRRNVRVTPVRQLSEPALYGTHLALGGAEHRAGAKNQQRAQVAIAALADAQQPAACRKKSETTYRKGMGFG